MFWLTVFVGIIATSVRGDTDSGFPCGLPCGSSVNASSQVVQYCLKNNFTLEGNRCCVNKTEQTIVGVDLSNCSLENVTGLFTNMTSLVYLSLENNPLNHLSAADFYRLTGLEYLSLPTDNASKNLCPGGYESWEENTVKGDRIECRNQLDTCQNAQNNETCPTPNSVCSSAGPGMVDCFCAPGYHGYKCLRQGSFPVVPFVGGLAGTTVVLAVFLWITQRRNVKKNS